MWAGHQPPLKLAFWPAKGQGQGGLWRGCGVRLRDVAWAGMGQGAGLKTMCPGDSHMD